MPVDPTKLRSAVRRLAKVSGKQKASLGITASIRELLPIIQRLRKDEGATWRVIAAALAEQGVTEGRAGKPISERRLTSVVRKLKVQDASRADRAAARPGRSDIIVNEIPRKARPTSLMPPRPNPVAAAIAAATPPPSEDAVLTEDDILRAQREKHRHLFKKDIS